MVTTLACVLDWLLTRIDQRICRFANDTAEDDEQ